MDGTLFKSESVTIPAVRETFRDAGLEIFRGIVTQDRRGDVEAAHHKFLKAIDAGYGSEDELKHADAVAATAGEIPTLVAQVLNN
jgi:phosphoglycolate phosphatase-like HAD superfamily hydrolase